MRSSTGGSSLTSPALKTYSGFPHGMPTTQAETINADLLAFLQS
jgi:non-heme chloroperoxidase